MNARVWALSVIGLCTRLRRASTLAIARSCPVNCINMKCRCIIDETIATFTVCAHMCACAGLTVHARLCCQPNTSASAISHNSAVWWLIFVFLCCVGLSWRFLFVCCCLVFTFLLFNLSFIYVCVGFFFLFWDFITSSCAFTIYKRNAGLMVRQQVKSASPWVCMFMWWVIWRERHHSFRSGVCVCVCPCE